MMMHVNTRGNSLTPPPLSFYPFIIILSITPSLTVHLCLPHCRDSSVLADPHRAPHTYVWDHFQNSYQPFRASPLFFFFFLSSTAAHLTFCFLSFIQHHKPLYFQVICVSTCCRLHRSPSQCLFCLLHQSNKRQIKSQTFTAALFKSISFQCLHIWEEEGGGGRLYG